MQKTRQGTWSLIVGILAVCPLPFYFAGPVVSHETRRWLSNHTEICVGMGLLIVFMGIVSVILAGIASSNNGLAGTMPSSSNTIGAGFFFGLLATVFGLFATVMAAHGFRSEMRADASGILHDMRMTDAAKDQYALENGKKDGANQPGLI